MGTTITHINQSLAYKVIQCLLVVALLTLPYVNIWRISTFALIGIVIVLVLHKDIFINYKPLIREPVFLALTGLFILSVLLFYLRPHTHSEYSPAEQKISLAIMLPAFYILTKNIRDIWRTAITAFVAGVIIASVFCLSTALLRYLHSGNSMELFYHRYSSAIGMNAIYFSLYLLIAITYLLQYWHTQNIAGRKKLFVISTIIFLYINLVLLSSKMLVIAGSAVLLLQALRLLKNPINRIAAASVSVIAIALLLLTDNPVGNRYRDIDPDTYMPVLSSNDFSECTLDGLSLRLLLWRIGIEVVNERKAWIWGLGDKHYEPSFNKKKKEYNLYTGNGTNSTGYLHYNLHNQYIQTYVQLGVAGLLLLAGLVLYLLSYSFHNTSGILFYSTLLFGIVFLTESFLETQSGILLFTIITSGEWTHLRDKTLSKNQI